MEIFTTRLKQLMEQEHVSKYKLAKAIKCDIQTVINWCKGKSEPRATQLVNVAIFFDVPTDYLLGLSK